MTNGLINIKWWWWRNKRSIIRLVRLVIVLFLIGLFPLVSCSPKIIETIKTETKTEYVDRVEWRDTTLYVPIPLGSGQVITSVKDTARAETTIARAESWVDELGKLNLLLKNVQGIIPYTTKLPSREIWTTVENTKSEILTKIEYRDKPLSRWQDFKIKAFWWLCVILLALVIWHFKEPIIKRVKLWIM